MHNSNERPANVSSAKQSNRFCFFSKGSILRFRCPNDERPKSANRIEGRPQINFVSFICLNNLRVWISNGRNTYRNYLEGEIKKRTWKELVKWSLSRKKQINQSNRFIRARMALANDVGKFLSMTRFERIVNSPPLGFNRVSPTTMDILQKFYDYSSSLEWWRGDKRAKGKPAMLDECHRTRVARRRKSEGNSHPWPVNRKP